MKTLVSLSFLCLIICLTASTKAQQSNLPDQTKRNILQGVGTAIAADSLCGSSLFPKALMEGQEAGENIADMSDADRPAINAFANSLIANYAHKNKSSFCVSAEQTVEKLILNQKSDIATPKSVTSLDKPDEKAIIVNGFDLRLETSKWVGKKLETRFNCIYADANEFRCVTLAGTRTDFTHFTNSDPAVQKSIENNCGTSLASTSSKCVFDIRYVYEERHVQDMENGSHIVFIRSTNDEGEVIVRRKR